MRIGFSTGYTEEFWAGWPFCEMYGGSERIVVEIAAALAALGHLVTVRLPRSAGEVVYRQVRWVGRDHRPDRPDILFCFDDFARRDDADRTILIACRSDPPPHREFDRAVCLSETHAKLVWPGADVLGGGVALGDYRHPRARIPRRVICTSSPDRCPSAAQIGGGFDFIQTYRWPGRKPLSREELVALQLSARVLIYPLDPVRPSDFFSMAVLEAMAAGTPVVVSDADAMAELWSDAAIVIPRPINLGRWAETVERLLRDRIQWAECAFLGRVRAGRYAWPLQAERLLKIVLR